MICSQLRRKRKRDVGNLANMLQLTASCKPCQQRHGVTCLKSLPSATLYITSAYSSAKPASLAESCVSDRCCSAVLRTACGQRCAGDNDGVSAHGMKWQAGKRVYQRRSIAAHIIRTLIDSHHRLCKQHPARLERGLPY